jgi:hypothetical protein
MAVAFEKVASSAAARDACFTAAGKWPHDRLALPGLGNPAFSQQDWRTDELEFRKVAAMALGPVRSLNNRALTLDA